MHNIPTCISLHSEENKWLVESIPWYTASPIVAGEDETLICSVSTMTRCPLLFTTQSCSWFPKKITYICFIYGTFGIRPSYYNQLGAKDRVCCWRKRALVQREHGHFCYNPGGRADPPRAHARSPCVTRPPPRPQTWTFRVDNQWG